jgi:hypothetical protein
MLNRILGRKKEEMGRGGGGDGRKYVMRSQVICTLHVVRLG